MLHFDTNNRKAFEAAVYNKEVRAAVKDNKSHVSFDVTAQVADGREVVAWVERGRFWALMA